MPCTPVREMDEVVNDPHMHGRGALRRVTHPELGGVVLTAAPLRYGDAPARDLRPSRPVGADTDAVLRDRLGLGDAEMAAPRAPSGRRARRRCFPFPVRTRD
jgi:CoA:oxalate CoA-transferase